MDPYKFTPKAAPRYPSAPVSEEPRGPCLLRYRRHRAHRRPASHHRRQRRPAHQPLPSPPPPAPHASPPKTGDAHRHVCTCCNASSRVTHAQSVPARAPVTIRTGGAALQVRGATEGKRGGIEGADARQSAARSTAPRWTHAQTTSSCWNTLAPAGEASRAPHASVYRSNCQLEAVAGSAVAGDAIAIGGLGCGRPPRCPLAGSACCTHASLLD